MGSVREEIDNTEDALVAEIEPILEKYKKSLHKGWKSGANIDFRNFAAHDIAKSVLSLVCKRIEGVENPYTTEYKYQCSMDAGMPQGLIVNDAAYTAFEECRMALLTEVRK